MKSVEVKFLSESGVVYIVVEIFGYFVAVVKELITEVIPVIIFVEVYVLVPVIFIFFD